jgi:hypothetical protein
MPAGSVAVQRFYADGVAIAAPPLSAPQVGVWDQWCVLNERPYSKEGDQSLMDEGACRAFLENFRRQPDDLPCNISHDKSQVVGFYNAMALFIGGVCVDFASHDATVQPPQVTELPGGDDGSPPDDGIYWRRRELTELGLAASTYLRKVSPEFYMRGKDQFEQEIGPLAVGGAWTNYPFLPGCEKHAFERTTTMPKPKTFAARACEEAGVKDDDPAKFSKLRSFWKGKHGAEYAKYEEEAGVEKDDDDEKAATKMTIFMAGRFGKDECAPPPAEMTGPTVTEGAPAVLNGGEANQNPVPGPTSMERGKAFQEFAKDLGLPTDPAAARAYLQTAAAARQALPALNQQVQELAGERAERKKSELRTEAQEFVRVAWAKGQIRPRANEKHEDARGRILQLYTQSGKAAAEAALNDPGSYTPPEAVAGVLQQFSSERPAQEASRPDDEILRRCAVEMEKDGIEDPTGKKTRKGVWHPDLGKYARAICQQDPQLGKRYAGQSRMALFEGLV